MGRSCMMDQRLYRNRGNFGQNLGEARTTLPLIPGTNYRNVYTPEKGFLF
jgi:hypothetical protein